MILNRLLSIVYRRAHVSTRGGFTIIEFLITFAILSALTGFVVFPLIGYKNTEEFNTQEKLIVATMRDAQQRSITREQGQAWGVRFTNHVSGQKYELFTATTTGSGMYGGGQCINPNGSVAPWVLVTNSFFLKNSVEFSDPSGGCVKDILLNAVSGTPNVPGVPGSFEPEVKIRQKNGTEIKTIKVQTNGTITF